MPTTVDIALAVDEHYAFPAAVTAYSVHAHLTRSASLAFHVIDHGLTPSSRTELARALDSWGSVEIYQPPKRLQLRQPSGRLTSAVLGRLVLGELLPVRVRNVLYLDCDLLALTDLTPLATADLAGNAVGAVLNSTAPHRSWTLSERAVSHETGATSPGYFNAGVLVIDLDRWREEDIAERALSLLERYEGDLPALDQDILNIVFAGRWTALPSRWNRLTSDPQVGRYGTGRVEELTQLDGITHFIGRTKPWHSGWPHNALRDLWKGYADRARSS